jgi:hypothetical protein
MFDPQTAQTVEAQRCALGSQLDRSGEPKRA